MRYFLNGVLGFLFSLLIMKAGVPVNSWYFWALFGLLAILITVQYIDR